MKYELYKARHPAVTAAAALVLVVSASAAVPTLYAWARTILAADDEDKDEVDRPQPGPAPELPMIRDAHDPVPAVGWVSRVRTQASPDSVLLPLKPTDPTSTAAYIPFSKLVTDCLPALRNGASTLVNPLLFSGHLQTMFAGAVSSDSVNPVYYARRCVTWDDGALVSADYLEPPPADPKAWARSAEYCPADVSPELDSERFPRPQRLRYLTPAEVDAKKTVDVDRPLLVLLHGLSGGSHESYIRSTVAQFANKGDFDCVVLNSRGCAATPITTPQLFCAGWTDDVRRFIRLLRAEEAQNNPPGTPRRRIYLVGFSLGASILANYLGQEGAHTLVDAAVVVANPWDLLHSNHYLEATALGQLVYSPVMAKGLRRLLALHSDLLGRHHPSIYGPAPLRAAAESGSANTIRGFDATFTAPAFGFDSVADYYRTCSSVHRLPQIRTPTLVLNSLDDPVVHKDCIPYVEAFGNPYVVLATTQLGGHLGWFTLQGPRGNRWFSSVVSGFFRAFDQAVDHAERENAPEPKMSTRNRLFQGDRLVV